MKLPWTPAGVSEQKAQRAIPSALPAPAGGARFAAKLAGDRAYRLCLLGAFALALLAGGSGGEMALPVPGFAVALWAVVATALISFSLQPLPPRDRMEQSPPDAAPQAQARRQRLFIRLLLPAAALMVFRSGRDAWPPLAMVLAIFLVLLWLRARPRRFAFANFLAALATPAAAALWNPLPGPWERATWLALALAASILFLFFAFKLKMRFASVFFTARVALIAWGFATLGAAHASASSSSAVPVLLATAFFLLDGLSLVAPFFAATVAAALALQLGGLAWTGLSYSALDSPGSQLPLLLQPAAALLGAALLAAAGLRHTRASLLQLPRSTYRIAPLCVVPRLDRAQDHPVKIDAL